MAEKLFVPVEDQGSSVSVPKGTKGTSISRRTSLVNSLLTQKMHKVPFYCKETSQAICNNERREDTNPIICIGQDVGRIDKINLH